MTTTHSAITLAEGIHSIKAYEYADAAARTGATGFVAADIGKVALQIDTGEYWILTATTPTWQLLGTSAALSAPANPGDDGKLPYASAGDLAYASGLLTDGSSYLAIGATAAGLGNLRLPANGSIYALDGGAADTKLIGLNGDTLEIGDDANPNGARYQIGTGNHQFQVAGVSQFIVTATGLQVPIGGASTPTGVAIGIPNNAAMWARNGAGTGNVNMIGVTPSDQLTVGGTGANVIWMRPNNTTAVVVGDAYLAIGTGTTATTGDLRLENTGSIQFKKSTSGNVNGLSCSAADLLTIGNANASGIDHVCGPGGVHEWKVDSTSVAFLGATYLALGTSAASAGILRLPNANLINFRNAAGTGDVNGLFCNAADAVQVGGTGATNVYINAPSLVATFGATYLALGANAASAGVLRLPSGTDIRFRNAANSGNIDALNATGADAVRVGGSGATSVEIAADGTTAIAVFDSTFMSLGTNPAQSGILRIPNSQLIYGRNNGGTADLAIAQVNSNDYVQFGGSGSVNSWLASTGTGNVAIGGAVPASWQSMQQGLFIGDRNAAPTGNPAAGGFLYSESGAGKWRGSSGTTTTFGPAEPHCPRCGRDCALEWQNDAQGWKRSVCVHCLGVALQAAGIPLNDFAIEWHDAA
jgi:hypothetical protein